MLRTSDIVTLSTDSATWATRPGVLFGCDVYASGGLSLGIRPGKFVTLNSKTAEIKGDTPFIGRVSPTLGTNRLDYVTAEIHNSSVYFRIIQGKEQDDPQGHEPLTLKYGILLAKIYVTHPCTSSDSLYIYNMLPAPGESICRTHHSVSVPDGVRTKFYFPFKFDTGYSIELSVGGIGGQVEGVDYALSPEIGDNGEDFTVVTFTEAPSPEIQIVANIYLGKTTL